MKPKKYLKHRMYHKYQFNKSMSSLLSKVKEQYEILKRLKEGSNRIPVTTVSCVLKELGIEDKCECCIQDAKE